MKKILIIILILFPLYNLFAYTETIITHDKVNCRDYPSIIKGKVLIQLAKGDRVYIYNVLTEKDNINGEEGNWYYVGTFGTSINGWVWGKYLDGIEYLSNIAELSIKRFERKDLASTVLKKIFSNSKEKFHRLDILGNYTLLETEITKFWQAKDNGFTEYNVYKIDIGDIGIFVNPKNSTFFFNSITIKTNNVSDKLQIGIDLETLEKVLGTDYVISEDTIRYSAHEDWDSYIF